MRSNLYLSAMVICVITISSCKKLEPLNANNKSVVPAVTSSVDVYAGGYVFGNNIFPRVVSYWKNGVLHKLSDSTEDIVGTGIAVHDSDIFVPGTITHANFSTSAAYWRDGVEILLENNATTANMVISKCGCDVYVAGDILINKQYRAVYWKNGVTHMLPGNSPSTDAACIAIANGDVYVTGSGISSLGVRYAMYWKNDTAYNLTDTLTASQGRSITIDGTDVYIAGSVNTTATYWKNGMAVTLPDPGVPNGSGATSIAVNSGNIYVTGAGGNSEGVYWENGIETHLSNTAYQAFPPNSIFISGSDVYIGGLASPFAGANRPDIPAYWKNNTLTLLPYTGVHGGSVMGMAVVPH